MRLFQRFPSALSRIVSWRKAANELRRARVTLLLGAGSEFKQWRQQRGLGEVLVVGNSRRHDGGSLEPVAPSRHSAHVLLPGPLSPPILLGVKKHHHTDCHQRPEEEAPGMKKLGKAPRRPLRCGAVVRPVHTHAVAGSPICLTSIIQGSTTLRPNRSATLWLHYDLAGEIIM